MFTSVFNHCPTNIYRANIELTSCNNSATTAKIVEALKPVLSGHSNNSCDDLANTSKAMCTDSQIAKDFKLGHLKLMYIVNYGIAPYFKQLLDAKLKKKKENTLSSDESLD